MKTEKAEKEVKSLIDGGLKFDYEFDYNNVNKLNISIHKVGFSIKDIISKLKDGEKIIFMINDGETWNGKSGNESVFSHNEAYDGSIYWEHKEYGDWVRVDSTMGSMREWFKELEESEPVKITLDESLDPKNIKKSLEESSEPVEKMKTVSENIGEDFISWAEKYWAFEKMLTKPSESGGENCPYSYIREVFVNKINELSGK